jgi:hypothetical protein
MTLAQGQITRRRPSGLWDMVLRAAQGGWGTTTRVMAILAILTGGLVMAAMLAGDRVISSILMILP